MMMDATSIGTELVLDVFRINGLLLAAGDGIAAREGLTSARWQVLGAVALADRPQTVPQIARRMGLTRQSVQVSVNHLADEGVVTTAPNTAHRRSPVVRLTEHGERIHDRLLVDQQAWIADLVADVPVSDLGTASRVLRAVADRLGAPTEPANGQRGAPS